MTVGRDMGEVAWCNTTDVHSFHGWQVEHLPNCSAFQNIAQASQNDQRQKALSFLPRVTHLQVFWVGKWGSRERIISPQATGPKIQTLLALYVHTGFTGCELKVFTDCRLPASEGQHESTRSGVKPTRVWIQTPHCTSSLLCLFSPL